MTTSTTPVRIKVDLFGSLRRHLPHRSDGPLCHTFAEPVTVAEALAVMAIEPEEDMAISLNGTLAAMDATLQDGDNITLFGPMEGG